MKATGGVVACALMLGPALGWANDAVKPAAEKPHEVGSRPVGFDSEEAAQSHCPKDEVVWLNRAFEHYVPKGDVFYGQSPGEYACKRAVEAAGYSAYQRLEDGPYGQFVQAWINNINRIFKRPSVNPDCKPDYTFLYLNGHVLDFQVLTSCGTEVDKAVVEAIKNAVRPPMPYAFVGRIISICLTFSDNADVYMLDRYFSRKAHPVGQH